jgi:hypothetical protein
MNDLNLFNSKKLYSTYSPLKTSKELRNKYELITSSEINSTINIRELYNKEISKRFLNESVIKAAFIEKFSFKKSPNNTITIFELNVGSSRADICMINGKSMVFEIKTEYDSFYRLERQLQDYFKVFQFVNVIIHESWITDTLAKLDSNVGIITYSKNRLGNVTFKEHRKPVYNNDIDSRTQLNALTKTQLKKVFKNIYKNNSDEFISQIIAHKSRNDITNIFNTCIKEKYKKKWNYIFENKENIIPLDYQWFFKNNLPINIVYK